MLSEVDALKDIEENLSLSKVAHKKGFEHVDYP
jgi:hypothetical protein